MPTFKRAHSLLHLKAPQCGPLAYLLYLLLFKVQKDFYIQELYKGSECIEKNLIIDVYLKLLS